MYRDFSMELTDNKIPQQHNHIQSNVKIIYDPNLYHFLIK